MHTKADVLHIGYPKAASTFLVKFLENHPEVTVSQFELSDLLQQIGGRFETREKPCLHKVHVSKDENIAESVCIVGELKNWQRCLYVPGAWDRVKNDILVDPGEAALRLHKMHPAAKISDHNSRAGGLAAIGIQVCHVSTAMESSFVRGLLHDPKWYCPAAGRSF